ncbi:MAG: hypothetical protein D6739_10120 [Nitrospirae bacterium]|nr:MAG: hypothetical protein D6739_10120 [Nitrospirota bacterium]
MARTTFSGRRFLTVARKLLHGARHDEASIRSAVSRAYYAAYWVGRDWAARHGSRELNHGALLKLIRQRAPTGHLAPLLSELYQARVAADYESGHHFTLGKARRLVRDAEAFIKALDATR